MSTDYIPKRDADAAIWFENFSTLLTANPTLYGLTAPIALVVAGVNATFQSAFLTSSNPSTRTAGTVAAKDVARAQAELVTRPYAVLISLNAAVSDMDKADIGVTIRQTVPSPIPAPMDAPDLSIQSAIPNQVRLTYKTPGTIGRAKPFGSIGVELIASIGTVFATDPSQCSPAGTWTRAPFQFQIDPTDAGKKISLFARYVTRSGPGGQAQAGPWSTPLNFVAM